MNQSPDSKLTPLPVVGVFDIGKTNKKFLLFDDDLSVVYRSETQFQEIVDDDGYPCEDVDRLVRWVNDTLEEILENSRYRIYSLNFSTYGASLVHLDKEGNVVTPLYSYFKPYPDDILAEFYESYGGRTDFSLVTASPPMGMLNSGLQLYWLKKAKKDLFEKIDKTLHLPQFISYLLTGKTYSELTSVGCHTGLWDFRKQDYHEWVEKENIRRLLPDNMPASTRVRILCHNHTLDAGIGIHDSSAALAPYLLLLDEPFVLVSTGTWSITFNPLNAGLLNYEELERDCLNYIDIQGRPVKASRFLLGGEYDFQLQKLKRHFPTDQETTITDTNLLEKLVKSDAQDNKLVLERSLNSGPYPQKKPRAWDIGGFNSLSEATHQLLLDLASIQADSINLATKNADFKKIIVTGGFSNNELFVRILASMFPDKEICTTQLSDSTALGAALVINQNESKNRRSNDLLGLKTINPLNVPGLDKYRWANGK